MTRAARLRTRVVILVALSGCATLSGVLGGACVLAEPPSDLPRLPPLRPSIDRAQLNPPADQVLTFFPSTFIVPVSLSDPTLSFQWAAFVDFNAFSNTGLVDFEDSVFDPNAPVGRDRYLTIPISPPSDIDQCHVIEVVVALKLLSPNNSVNAHTPADPTGADTVTWFYSPNGYVSGCAPLDAGIDASFLVPDAEWGVQ